MKTAMVLCAGLGTRMKKYTMDLPKPMIDVNGKPLLEYTIRHLAMLGITNIVINLHYLPQQIWSYFGNGKKFGVSITYTYEDELLGTAGAVKHAEKFLEESGDFIVIHGDVVCNENYLNMVKFHKSKENAIATILIHERKESNSVVEIDADNKVTRFIERPDKPITDKKQNWVNSGVYCFNKSIFNCLFEDCYTDFPAHVFNWMSKEGLMYGYKLMGNRVAVDSEERLERLEYLVKLGAFDE